MNDASETKVMEFVARNLDIIPFKTLRHGEEELPQSQQLTQMKATLHDDPGLFLSKWGRYLSQNSLRLFQVIQGNYEVDFYLDSLLYLQEEPQQLQLQPQSQPHKKSAMQLLAHNRRFEFLQRELRHSDYYSDESIQLREPTLYDQFIGQYIPAREKTKPFDNDMTLVNRIFSNMDRKFVDDHLYEQKIKDEEQFEEEEEEEEDDDEEDMEMEMEKSTPVVVTKKKSNDVEMKEVALSDDDAEKSSIEDEEEEEEEEEEDTEQDKEFREEQKAELIRLLEEKFLDGKDEFDYDEVDFNEDYDDLEQLEQDIHDRYFDEDD